MMIGPIFLRGELIEKFRKHISEVPYHRIIGEGKSVPDQQARILTSGEVEAIIHQFEKSAFPIICFAGSKSTIPFFDYHIALDYGEDKTRAIITELLVRGPKEDNTIKGILMAYYFILNERMKIEAIQVPFRLAGVEKHAAMEEITIRTDQNITYLTKQNW